jgi:penicillin-binding protein 1A
MYSMLKDVVRYGTATRAKALGRNDLAGKTGTTNDFRDAWFNGFNESMVTVVWVGHDDFSSLGRREAAGSAALPGWIAYMKVALDGVAETSLEPPSGILAQQVGDKTEFFDTTVTPDYTPDAPVAAGPEEEIPEDSLF